MTYQHRYIDGSPFPHTLGKVVCVGRNYADHARELNNPIPSEPLLFLKPATSVVDLEQPLRLPGGRGEVHYETEIALLIGTALSGPVDADTARAAIAGVGLGLDLTLRELQEQLKSRSHPWERAKAFDGACPLTPFVPVTEVPTLEDLRLQLSINGRLRQDGSSSDMITPIVRLLQHIAEVFTLMPGDVVLAGTPAGIGPLHPGDELELSLPGLLRVNARVAAD